MVTREMFDDTLKTLQDDGIIILVNKTTLRLQKL